MPPVPAPPGAVWMTRVLVDGVLVHSSTRKTLDAARRDKAAALARLRLGEAKTWCTSITWWVPDDGAAREEAATGLLALASASAP